MKLITIIWVLKTLNKPKPKETNNMKPIHIKTRYSKIGEPSNKTKDHIGDRIKFEYENGYKIPSGTEGTINKMTLSVNPYYYNKRDWFYRVVLETGKSKWIMASGAWEVIIQS